MLKSLSHGIANFLVICVHSCKTVIRLAQVKRRIKTVRDQNGLHEVGHDTKTLVGARGVVGKKSLSHFASPSAVKCLPCVRLRDKW